MVTVYLIMKTHVLFKKNVKNELFGPTNLPFSVPTMFENGRTKCNLFTIKYLYKLCTMFIPVAERCTALSVSSFAGVLAESYIFYSQS